MLAKLSLRFPVLRSMTGRKLLLASRIILHCNRSGNLAYLRQELGRRAPAWGLLLALSTFVTIGGCAQWAPDSDQPTNPLLPKTRKSPDAVVVESVLVRYSKAKQDKFQEVWQRVDETAFDIQLRSVLDENGLRAGILVGELPEVVRNQIAETSEAQNTDALEHAGLAADADNKMRHMQCRAGRRKELIVRPQLNDPLTILGVHQGQTLGNTFDRPTVLFDLRTLPHGDRTTTVELTPEVQHGELKQSFVSSEFGVRPETRRERMVWEDLKLQVKLRPREILVVGATLPSKALGKAFFSTQLADQTEENLMLLLRVAETQTDDLFAPEDSQQTSLTGSL